MKLYKGTTLDITARAVLLVDDILDTGRSLSLARDLVRAKGPIWLRTCVLLGKPRWRAVPINADYVGFEIPDVWVIGFGLDAAGADGRSPTWLPSNLRGDRI